MSRKNNTQKFKPFDQMKEKGITPVNDSKKEKGITPVNDSKKEKGITPVNDSKKEKGIPSMLYSKVVEGEEYKTVPAKEKANPLVSPGTAGHSRMMLKSDTPLVSDDRQEDPGATFGPEVWNYIRLIVLAQGGGLDALRKQYSELLLETSFRDAIQANLEELRDRKEINDNQLRILSNPDLDKLDITLLGVLIRNNIGFSNKNVNSEYKTVIRIRNELCHVSSIKLSDQYFRDKFRELSNSLNQLGINAEQIDQCLRRSIGQERLQKLVAELQELVRNMKELKMEYDLYTLQVIVKESERTCQEYWKESIQHDDPDSFTRKAHRCHVKGNEFMVELIYYGKIVGQRHLTHVQGGSSLRITYLNLEDEEVKKLLGPSSIPTMQLPCPIYQCEDLSQYQIDNIKEICKYLTGGLIIRNHDGCVKVERRCLTEPYYVSVISKDPRLIETDGSFHQIFKNDDFCSQDKFDPAIHIFMGTEKILYKNRNDPNIPVTIKIGQCIALADRSLILHEDNEKLQIAAPVSDKDRSLIKLAENELSNSKGVSEESSFAEETMALAPSGISKLQKTKRLHHDE